MFGKKEENKTEVTETTVDPVPNSEVALADENQDFEFGIHYH